jgi:hypothetical protein
MSNPSIPPPVRPTDLTGVSLRELLDAWHLHTAPLVYARHGLDALAAGQALTDQLMAMRWVTAAETLANSATLEHTAAAMGLDVDEVAVGLRMWADGQHQHAGMSAAARDEVYALLGEVTR